MKQIKKIIYKTIDNPWAKLLGALCIIGPSLVEMVIEWRDIKENFHEEGLQLGIGIMMLFKIIAELLKLQKKIARARTVFKSTDVSAVANS